MYYIQETDKLKFFMKLFNIIKIKEDKIILPIKDEIISDRKANRLARKTNRFLEKTNCNKLVISKKIKKQEIYINNLYSYDFDIVNGKWLFEVLSCQVIDYVVKKKKMKKEEITISILINDVTDIMYQNIKKISKEYKRVNIVTNHIEVFKRMEEEILEEDGIIITIGNNKKKSLMKSNIILNVDFPTDIINQYNINEYAIIINLKGNVKINSKRFNGININNYEISYKRIDELEYEKNNLFENKDIYEANISKKQPFDVITNRLNNDKVMITKLFGNKSEI